ncbi:MAG TPA: LUD domain-containing protein [Candidatus Acidoferrales bacterium]|nr:LUD domain-containing protein [Candidatus Acidoferrales bacterium]
MKDSREKIFAAIRHGLRESKKFVAIRNDRSPLKRILNGGFASLFEKFNSELKSLGGEAVVFDDEKDASKFISGHAGERLFVYDEALSGHEHLIDEVSVPVSMSSNFNFGYDKRDAAVFDSALSSCIACIAETGTVVTSNNMRLPAALATKLFVIAESRSLIPSLDDLFKDEYKDFKGSNLFLISGPSRTADIEKELVTGVHGPKEVYVIFINKNE